MILPDCVLFPHGSMPLHIFEPRYREMLSDALKGDCIFAIVNRPSGEERACQIGTIGLIRASKEDSDGTSNLLLHGFLRVRIDEWLDDRLYPRARITPLTFELEIDQEQTKQMTGLRKKIDRLLRGTPPEVRDGMAGLLDRSDHPHVFADVVAQHFLHEPRERQRLLETNDGAERLKRLSELLA